MLNLHAHARALQLALLLGLCGCPSASSQIQQQPRTDKPSPPPSRGPKPQKTFSCPKEQGLPDRPQHADDGFFNYPNPRIHRRWPAPQGSFKIIEVYDASQLNEDPIGTTLWIEHADGHKQRLSPEAISAIVRKEHIVPTTEEQAWAWASLFVRCDNYSSSSTIWKPGSPAPDKVPPEIVQKLRPRSIRQMDNGWEISFLL